MTVEGLAHAGKVACGLSDGSSYPAQLVWLLLSGIGSNQEKDRSVLRILSQPVCDPLLGLLVSRFEVGGQHGQCDLEWILFLRLSV